MSFFECIWSLNIIITGKNTEFSTGYFVCIDSEVNDESYSFAAPFLNFEETNGVFYFDLKQETLLFGLLV